MDSDRIVWALVVGSLHTCSLDLQGGETRQVAISLDDGCSVDIKGVYRTVAVVVGSVGTVDSGIFGQRRLLIGRDRVVDLAKKEGIRVSSVQDNANLSEIKNKVAVCSVRVIVVLVLTELSAEDGSELHVIAGGNVDDVKKSTKWRST